MTKNSTLTGTEIHRIKTAYAAPDFVKSASTEQIVGNAELDVSYFGDPVNRQYPFHTKAAAWTSFLLFLEKRASYRTASADAIEDRLKQAGKVHGILETMKEAAVLHAASSTVGDDDLDDSHFGMVFKAADGSKQRHMRMCNALETRKAASYLMEHRDKFSFDDRRRVAEHILEKAAQFGSSLGDLREPLIKQACEGTCTAADAVDLIEGRVHASRTGPGALNEQQSGLLKLAALFRVKPAQVHDGSVRIKLASVLHDFDRDHGLTSLVRDGHLSRIEDVLFAITGEKIAEAAREHAATITGNVYHTTDVERIKLASIRGVLGDDIAEAMTSDGVHVDGEKAASVIPTLPRGDAQLFDRLMAEAGASPVVKQADAQDLKIDREYLQELASRVS